MRLKIVLSASVTICRNSLIRFRVSIFNKIDHEFDDFQFLAVRCLYSSKGIRAALRDASNKLESQIAGLHIKVDEATSNQVGALHIPNVILQNISNSDVLVVDLSTVGSTIDGAKKLQNPNVLIELGYAISQLGWDRIIVLFNKEFGDFKDFPFDIEKRSCLDFKIISEDDKNGIGVNFGKISLLE